MRLSLVLCIIMCFSIWANHSLLAQQSAFDTGIRINTMGNDHGVGVSLGWTHSSGHFKMRWDGHINGLNHLKETDENITTTVRSRYFVQKISFLGVGFLGEHMKLYGGGGPVLGHVGRISSSNVRWGSHGFYGFSWTINRMEFSIEMGGIGGLGNADIFLQQPLIGTGLYLAVGHTFTF